MDIALKIQDSMIKDIRYIFQREAVSILFNLQKIFRSEEYEKTSQNTQRLRCNKVDCENQMRLEDFLEVMA